MAKSSDPAAEPLAAAQERLKAAHVRLVKEGTAGEKAQHTVALTPQAAQFICRGHLSKRDFQPTKKAAPYSSGSDTNMTTIGASLIINGQVTSREDITIHGRVIGEISMESGALLVAPSANIDARVRATKLTIHGTMAGDIAAAERVELTDTATVSGTLLAPAVVMREGAFFNGAIAVDRHRDGAAR